jgi:hypothetical protein
VTSASFSAPVPGRPAADPPAPPEGFGVVITGGTKGVGFAMARAFLRRGDRVCVCGRSQTRVDDAVAALRAEFPGACVSGRACDVTDPRDVDAFGDYAASTVGVIHHWLNNAGVVAPARAPHVGRTRRDRQGLRDQRDGHPPLLPESRARDAEAAGRDRRRIQQRSASNKEGAAKPPKPPNTGPPPAPKTRLARCS